MQNSIIIAVDAMGGDGSPQKIINGINLALKENNNIKFNIFGDINLINPLLKNNQLVRDKSQVIHTDIKIEDHESPLSAAKKGDKSSMWNAINSVKQKKSDVILSAGNTGALLILSKMILEMISGIDKPALAGLWPNKNGMNIVLDLGANIECGEKNLIDFSFMGAALYKSLFPDVDAKIAILNVGSEEIKGHDVIKNTYNELKKISKSRLNFKGYIEGNNIMDGKINVIITDGFTGNIALKTAEGTANFISKSLKDTMTSSFLGKISAFFISKNLRKFKDKLDPRKYNGAILLGLNGPVVKSHGSTDSLGFAYSIKMCTKIAEGNLIKKIKEDLSN